MTKQDADKGVPPLDLCPFCGKKIADSSRAGSLTSFLFQANNCQCGVRSAQPDRGSQKDSINTFCPRCGLQIVSGSSAGSLTGFLFQDTRCKCPPESLTNAEHDRAQQVYKSVELAPGVVIGGMYRIIKLIGRGGMGEVYQAQHLTLDKTCAVKLIPANQVTDMGWQRFQIEAKSIAKLDHINLVKVIDFGIHDGCLPYYAMEFVDGETLAEMLVKRGAMHLNNALDLFMQVCDGLDYAHRNGIVHRDLKPANIMLSTLPTGNRAVKILDFGLAKLTQNDRSKQSLTSVGDVFGSPYYMSPEQCVGGKIDNRSDIYSLGCTLFESLTGRPPFVGPTAVEIVSGHQGADPPSLESLVGSNVFPQAMEVVLAKLLRKNPVERYQTLLELRGDLQKVAHGDDVQPFYMSRSSHLPSQAAEENLMNSGEDSDRASSLAAPWRRRSLVISGLVVGLLVSLAVIASLSLSRSAVKTIALSGRQGQGDDAKTEEPTDMPVDPEALATAPDLDMLKAQAIFKKSGPIKSTPVTIKGIKKRKFVFPDWPIGKVGVDIVQAVPACGVVYMPVDKGLTLEIGPGRSRQVFNSPEIVAKIEGSEFDTLRIDGGKVSDLSITPNRMQSSTKGLIYILKAAGKWSNLRFLWLANLSMPKEAFAPINDYQNFHQFTIDTPTMAVKDLANQAFLSRIQCLALRKFGTVDPTETQYFFHKLAQSPNLHILSLDSWNINPGDLLQLRSSPKLYKLTLDHMDIDRLVPVLTRLPSLQDVNVGGAGLNPGQIKFITACPNIRHLVLSKKMLSPETINYCRSNEPKVVLSD